MKKPKISRVLLLSLPAIIESSANENDFNISHAFNLGLAYIAGLLRKSNFNVRILDCLVEAPYNIRSVEDEWCEIGLSDEQILESIAGFDPDLIGIALPFSYQHFMALKLVQKIKSVFPDILIAVGGNHVTAVPEKIDLTYIDYLVVGEGEYTLQQLINAINDCQPVNEIPGIVAQDTLNIACAPGIKDLDNLPFPAIDLLPLEKLWGKGRRWINMVATRGCVFDCVFCSIHTIMGYTIRRRSVENVIAEIKYWHKVYKIQEIYFEDDNLTANRKWAKELFKQIAENKFGIRLYARNGIRADTIDKELLTLMKAAGYQDFFIAPESGSQVTLDNIIGKKMKLEDCVHAVELAREVGIRSNAFFVFGFPRETMQDIQATLSFARRLKELGCDGFWFSLAVPYPGTRLFKQCLENGDIVEGFDYRKLRVAKSVIINDNCSSEQLESIRNNIMSELSHHNTSYSNKIVKAFLLFIRDPSFFFTKLSYKFGILSGKSMNRQIIQNAANLISKELS